jgi:uncharacterized YigZ family protein
MMHPMKEPYPIPARETRIEFEVENSRFIATAAPCFSVEEARSFIQKVKAEFSDASHNVPAFVIGYGASVTSHCHDDGEPSGTAGRPALAVLQGSGLGDTVVVVTRYFGGIKLGKGGLVRAYGDAVRVVLEALPRAVRQPVDVALLALPYSLFERVRLLAEENRGAVVGQDFAGDVTLTLEFPAGWLERFQQGLQDLSRGELQAELIETVEKIVPL